MTSPSTNPQQPAMSLSTAPQPAPTSPAAPAEAVKDTPAAPPAIPSNGGNFSGGPIPSQERRVQIGDISYPLPEGAVHTAVHRGAPPLKLLKKLADIMADLNWVEKRGHNSHFGYDYATESDILAAIRPRLAGAGIFVHTIVESETATPTGKTTRDGGVIMRHRVQLLHIFNDSESGETLEGVGIGYSNDDSDKGFYKAYTGAVKYFFAKTFLVSTGDDPENLNPEEREAAKKARKEKQQTDPGPAGPRRSENAVQTPEGEFTVVSTVDRTDEKKVSGGKIQYRFVIPNVGTVSTVSKPLADKVLREKGTGMPVRFHISRNGSWLNLENAEVLPPGSMS